MPVTNPKLLSRACKFMFVLSLYLSYNHTILILCEYVKHFFRFFLILTWCSRNKQNSATKAPTRQKNKANNSNKQKQKKSDPKEKKEPKKKKSSYKSKNMNTVHQIVRFLTQNSKNVNIDTLT